MRSDNLKKFVELHNALVEEKQELEGRLDEINRALGVMAAATGKSSSGVTASGTQDRRKGPKSAAWKAAIAAAQKARWARLKGGLNSSSAEQTSSTGRKQNSRGPRQMSPEAKAKIAEAARRRWKAAKAAGKSTL